MLWASLKRAEVSNGLIALATVVIAIAGGWTWWEAHGAGEQTDKLISAANINAGAAKKSAQASRDFADTAGKINAGIVDAVGKLDAQAQAMEESRISSESASTRSLTAIIDNFHQEQRAWVGVQEAIPKPPTETAAWNVRIIFFNSGKTPARNVQSSTMFMTSDIPLSRPTADEVKQLEFRPVQSIAPQGRYNLIIGISPPAEASSITQKHGNQTLITQYPYIKSGQLFLYYFGMLKYDDAFGNHRWTQFCILLANPETGEVGFCDGFNDLT